MKRSWPRSAWPLPGTTVEASGTHHDEFLCGMARRLAWIRADAAATEARPAAERALAGEMRLDIRCAGDEAGAAAQRSSVRRMVLIRSEIAA